VQQNSEGDSANPLLAAPTVEQDLKIAQLQVQEQQAATGSLHPVSEENEGPDADEDGFQTLPDEEGFERAVLEEEGEEEEEEKKDEEGQRKLEANGEAERANLAQLESSEDEDEQCALAARPPSAYQVFVAQVLDAIQRKGTDTTTATKSELAKTASDAWKSLNSQQEDDMRKLAGQIAQNWQVEQHNWKLHPRGTYTFKPG
jgi:hypothetical protein